MEKPGEFREMTERISPLWGNFWQLVKFRWFRPGCDSGFVLVCGM